MPGALRALSFKEKTAGAAIAPQSKPQRALKCVAPSEGLVCTDEEQKLLLPSLVEHLVELSCDQHGTHVVQRALMSFGLQCPDVLLHELASNLRKAAGK